MYLFKALQLFCLLNFFVSIDCCGLQEQNVHIKIFRCKVNDKYVYSNFSCYAKSFNRTCSTGTTIGTTKMPLNKIFLEGQLFFKYGTIYCEVMKLPRVELCSLFSSTTSNILIKQLMSIAKDSAPGLIHECPYTGVDVKHKSVKTGTVISLFPTGDYRVFGDDPLLW